MQTTSGPAQFLSVDDKPHLLLGKDQYDQNTQRNIENLIGLAKIPVGLAGPIRVEGEHANGEFYIPLATTEGTLVASTSRGAKILNQSGGVKTGITRRGGIQRAPVFVFAEFKDAKEFADAIQSDWQWLAPVVESTTRIGKLIDISCFVAANHVHLRFSMDSGDAAGQNMVSIAVQKGVEAIRSRYPSIKKVWMEGGFSGEKVSSNLNMLYGRGRGVTASAAISAETLFTHTRARAQDIVEFYEIYTNANLWTGAKNNHASLINILPAIYIATGQDVACVPESCTAQTFIQYDSSEQVLRWQIMCPNIVAATVGGGTHLPTQKECLEIMTCAGPGHIDRFAELCAATALANEISFVSAICAQEWVNAHEGLRTR